MRHKHVALILALALLVPAASWTQAAGHKYPKTDTGDIVDDHHGTMVKDPYRWLEDDVRTSDNVASWVEAQNVITFGYLEGLDQREPIRERLTELWDYEKYSSPFKNAGQYFYFKNNGLQNQTVFYTVEDALDGTPTVVLDPNTWSEDGTIALAGLSFSDDGKYLAYAKADAGSDWTNWYIRDMASGKDLPEMLTWTKFTGTAWTGDSKGFFYSRFDAVAEEDKFQALNKNQKLYYHRVGTPQDDDVLVYHRPDEPEWGFAGNVTEDGRYLVVSVWKGTDPRNRVLYKDLLEPYGMPIDLIDNFDSGFSLVGNDGPVFFFETDHEAPNGRLIAIDVRKPEKSNWTVVIPESDLPLRGVGLTGNMFVASYLRDAVSYVRMFRTDGTHVRDVEFPGIGGGGGFGGKRSEVETFYTYSSFNRPPTIYRYDMLTGKSAVWKQAKVAFDPDAYEVSQIFYKSKDGTKVPMFLAHKKGLELDGRRPTLLYGYGGFNISLTPGFSVSRLTWMEMGGVFAMANLRGGGEYGKAWHDQGKKTKKQNVFDDFIGAAEWLIANDYTNPDKLAIQGGSNGGLLVGATMTQRPELFAAALPAVGVMDMLRFHKFTAGRYWVDDYGSADNAEEFAALYAYSPYHNLKPGVRYPATLVTTADTDDRVVPGHSFKFAAALQKAHKGDEPVMIRIETRAGHGSGKPTALRIEESADQMAFLAENLSMELPPPYDDKPKN
jgi:prolyl oligopeptidase